MINQIEIVKPIHVETIISNLLILLWSFSGINRNNKLSSTKHNANINDTLLILKKFKLFNNLKSLSLIVIKGIKPKIINIIETIKVELITVLSLAFRLINKKKEKIIIKR